MMVTREIRQLFVATDFTMNKIQFFLSLFDQCPLTDFIMNEISVRSSS